MHRLVQQFTRHTKNQNNFSSYQYSVLMQRGLKKVRQAWRWNHLHIFSVFPGQPVSSVQFNTESTLTVFWPAECPSQAESWVRRRRESCVGCCWWSCGCHWMRHQMRLCCWSCCSHRCCCCHGNSWSCGSPECLDAAVEMMEDNYVSEIINCPTSSWTNCLPTVFLCENSILRWIRVMSS